MTPTRKWWAATVTAIGVVATAWATAGFTDEVKIALIGLIVQRAVAYWTPNDESAGIVDALPHRETTDSGQVTPDEGDAGHA